MPQNLEIGANKLKINTRTNYSAVRVNINLISTKAKIICSADDSCVKKVEMYQKKKLYYCKLNRKSIEIIKKL